MISNDPRVALLKDLPIEVKSLSTSEISDGDFEGEWTAKNKRKKFKRRKIIIKFDSCLCYVPSSIQLMDVEYVGTASLKVVRITKKQFICKVSSRNTSGGVAKLNFNWKTIK